MNKRSNAVVPHDDDEEEEFDSDSNEQLIVREQAKEKALKLPVILSGAMTSCSIN